MHSRVRTYRIKGNSGGWHTESFNKWHAKDVSTELEEDGIALDKAIALVRYWNRVGARGSWEYYIPFVSKSLTT